MRDEELGRLLLRPLDTEPAEPSRIDVSAAMRDGRRGRWWRNWMAAAGVTAVIATATTGGVLAFGGSDPAPLPPLPPDPNVPSACTFEVLPMGEETSAEVRAADPSGTYVVGQGDPFYEGKNNLMMWRDGDLIAHVRQTGKPVLMSDVNGSGVAVGSTDGWPTVPYVYRDEKISRLRGTGQAIAVNDAGMIAGTEETSRRYVPQRWASPDAEPEIMKMPAGITNGRVWDMAEDGTILVSVSGSMTTSEEPYLWYADGRVERIPPPPGTTDQSFGMTAFHHGWIYGYSSGSASSGVSGPYTFVHRYDPVSQTWETVDAGVLPAQVPGAGGPLTGEVSVIVGREIVTLPTERRTDDDGFLVESISGDARIMTGTVLSLSASDIPARPILWRCE
ncbi:hypothetical protein [Actinoplanes sp. GCM10030250]|uniref:hypothetical protein n=1 Tax=Actinoplanes sp. GCM10030250 TaxID=3273376 RepID=UPI00361963AA